MKLTLDRREQKATLFGFGKLPGYFLDYTIEVTDEERKIITEQKWDKTGLFTGPRGTVELIGRAISEPRHLFFDDIGSLQASEMELMEGLKALKSQIETAANFTSHGPQVLEF